MFRDIGPNLARSGLNERRDFFPTADFFLNLTTFYFCNAACDVTEMFFYVLLATVKIIHTTHNVAKKFCAELGFFPTVWKCVS